MQSLSDYHLSGVNSLYGGEISYEEKENGDVFLKARINAMEDLVLTTDHIDVIFRIPNGYPGSVKAGASQITVAPAPGYYLPTGVALQFPWLSQPKNSSYPLSIWFFTVRDSLKRSSAEWDSSSNPVLLRPDFPYPVARNSASSSTTITSHRVSGITLTTGAGRTRGKRPYMEDVDFSYPTLNISNYHKAMHLLGVCDGHGGAECAQFIADELPAKATQLLRAQQQRSLAPAIALFQSFQSIDKEYLDSSTNNAGSTACVMLWDGGQGNEICYIANTGDTRAVLCRSGQAVDLTIDRKASDPEEVARMARMGGFVKDGRVMGSLAVSRAIGDSDLKRGRGRFAIKNADGSRSVGVTGVLVADPEITSFRPLRPSSPTSSPQDQFIIIATDGLWDVMSSQQAVDALHRRVSQGIVASLEQATESELQRLADSLAAEAVAMGSQDNITVRIVVFHGEAFPVVPEAPAVLTAVARTVLLPPRSLSPAPGAAPVREPPISSSALSVSSVLSRAIISSSSENVDPLVADTTGLPPRSANATLDTQGPNGYSSRIIGTVGSSRFGKSDSNSSFGSIGSGDSGTNKTEASKKNKNDDDLMSFLLDDGNF